MVSNPKSLHHQDYHVGWICALPKEQAAALAMLDGEKHGPLPKPDHDDNTYHLGSIGGHNIVIACLPDGDIGTNSAANMVTQMVNTFPSIKFALMVGIGGGIPPRVRLGDIVVSKPSGQYPGVIQWDMGKAEHDGFTRTSSLDRPPKTLLTALANLKSSHELNGPRIPDYLNEMVAKYPRLKDEYLWSNRLKDHQFESYNARHNQRGWWSIIPLLYQTLVALFSFLLGRQAFTTVDDGISAISDAAKDKRKPGDINIHYGLIASGNQVIKNSAIRDWINKSLGGQVLCIEMEAAGLMNNLPCIVIRGICDYADTQKNNGWQKYAAAIAAAFAKELLQFVQPADVDKERPVKDILTQVYEDTAATRQGVNQIQGRMDEKETRKILDWLTTVDYGSQHSEHSTTCQKGTGQWVLESEEFQNWLMTSRQTLLCQGIPGAGKTIVTSVVVNHLELKSRENSGIGVAYIYCNFKQQDNQDTEKLLASILKQLAAGQNPLPPEIKNLYKQHQAKRTRPSEEELATGLKVAFDLYSKVFVVIDALDECRPSSMMPFIFKLFKLQEESEINIFATSRFIPETTELFRKAKSAFLEIRAHSSDVIKYIENQINQPQVVPYAISCDSSLREEIKRDISEAADGMFLLAQIYFTLLTDKTNANDVRKQLQIFKSRIKNYNDNKIEALTLAYEQAIDRIDKQKPGLKALANHVLLWITFAKRELTLSELRHALATKQGMTTTDDNNLPYLEDIGMVCAGLVRVDEKSDIIRLVHYTAHEYFEKIQSRWFPEANSAIFNVCITYLSFDIFEAGFCTTDKEFEERLQRFPLCKYAAANWGYHMPREMEPREELLSFLKSPGKIAASVQMQLAMKKYINHSNYSQEAPRNVTGLHLAGQFGSTGIAKTLLNLGDSPHIQDSDCQTPLLWATRYGHGDGVELLLNADADPEVRDREEGATPLIWAARNGYEAIVNLLLTNGREVNAKDLANRTPLSLAAIYKHKAIIRLLLKHGGIIDSNDTAGKVELLVSGVERGAVMDMVFGNDTNPDTEGQDSRTLLSRAAESGDKDLVQLLTTGRKVDINAKDSRNGETPLIWAAKKGHEEIVMALLEAGADVNIKEKKMGETALTLAIEIGHEAIIQALLKKGASVHSRDNSDHTPLFTACWLGIETVVQLLLGKDADVNAKNTSGQTPIFNAASCGYIDVVRRLLDAGADIDVANMDGRTPIFFAAALGRLAVVSLLLERGANAGLEDHDGRTALFSAIGSGEEAVVKMLLDTGKFDIGGMDKKGTTPLEWAEIKGKEGIIQLLGQASADQGPSRP